MHSMLQAANLPLLVTFQLILLLPFIALFKSESRHKNLVYLLLCVSIAICLPVIVYAIGLNGKILYMSIIMFPALGIINFLIQSYCTSCGIKILGFRVNKRDTICSNCRK